MNAANSWSLNLYALLFVWFFSLHDTRKKRGKKTERKKEIASVRLCSDCAKERLIWLRRCGLIISPTLNCSLDVLVASKCSCCCFFPHTLTWFENGQPVSCSTHFILSSLSGCWCYAVSGCDRQTILTRDTHICLHSEHVLTEQFQFAVQDIRQLQLCVSMACTIKTMLCIIKCHDVDIFSLLYLWFHE